MPKAIKKKPVKKRTVQDEEVKSAALQALEKMKERQRQLIIGVSVVVAIIILYVVFSLYSSSMANKAYSLEQDAYKYYYGENIDESMTDEDRWKKALELYKKSVDSKATPTALFYIANSYYNLNDYDNAIKEYNRFVSTFSSDRGILPLVYQKLASTYFLTNQNDKALETLGKLAGFDGGTFKDTAMILEARYYESTGEKEKAMERYRAIVSDFPVSPWSAEASSKISAEEAKNAEASPDEPAADDGESSKVPEAEAEKNNTSTEKTDNQ
jgi:tetratricopeptide (TPR) repeat protein